MVITRITPHTIKAFNTAWPSFSAFDMLPSSWNGVYTLELKKQVTIIVKKEWSKEKNGKEDKRVQFRKN